MRVAFVSTCLAALSGLAAAAPKLLISSDSTTANYDPSNALQGWGYFIGGYLTINVNNLARNGRSTRSFITEGLWSSLLSATNAGDFVLIEMGHNDDGDPTDTSQSRATLKGIGEETITVKLDTGVTETVHTFGWYLRKMIADVKAKNAVPIISGMVNRNYWTGNTLQSSWPFADWAKQVADQQGVEYVDHTGYSVTRFQAMGPTTAKTYFPNDNTHTNAAGARINAETFVQAFKCNCKTSALKQYLNSAGQGVSNPACKTSCGVTSTTSTSKVPTPTGGTCAALWGQCGGEGWTGPKCCASGTCTVSNQWYSQCL